MFLRRRRPLVTALLVLAGAAGLGLACAAATPAAADSAEVGNVYDVTFAGFPIATGTLALEIDGNAYKARVSVRAKGIVGLFTDERIEAAAAGRLRGNRVEPASYSLDENNGKRLMTVRMGLASGEVRSLDVSPAPKTRADTVPLETRHRRGILDPVSAILMPTPARAEALGPAACARTLPIYDGYTRFDVPLAFVGTRSIETKGYTGDVAVCSARWVPIAGHRRNKDSVKFMASNRNLEVWLAPIGGTALLVPYRVSVGTRSGTLVVQAREITVTGPKFTALP